MYAIRSYYGSAEEALWPLQGVGVDTTGQYFSGRRRHRVVGACKAGDGVEQDDHVVLVLDQALGPFDHHFGHLHVAGRRLVEGGADHLGVDRALHVRHFFGLV